MDCLTPKHSDKSLIMIWAHRFLLPSGGVSFISTRHDLGLSFGPQTPKTTIFLSQFGTGRLETLFSYVGLIELDSSLGLTLLPSLLAS
jgi:hypothetical protein